MFGYVTASLDELNDAQKNRYGAVYCGICRCMGKRSSQLARLALRYDCAFLALVHMSLYEPQEAPHTGRCAAHPLSQKPWLENEAVQYAADMNVALAYYKCLDDWRDDKKLPAKALASALQKSLGAIESRYPRQCGAIRSCLAELSALEAENSGDIDRCAGCFGRLLGELMVFREDFWADTLRQLGYGLGRFIYIADALCDLEEDRKAGNFNPYLAKPWPQEAQQEHLVLAMAHCSRYFEQLPLVQDKEILNNIIYSGVWTRLNFGKKEDRRGRSV